MDKSLIIFDLNSVTFKSCSDEEERYCVNALMSVFDDSRFPFRFAQIGKAFKKTINMAVESRQRNFFIHSFDLAHIFTKELKINDTPTLKKCYDIFVYSGLQFPVQFVEGLKESLSKIKNENKKIALLSLDSGIQGSISWRFHMQEAKIYDSFDDVVFAEDVGLIDIQTLLYRWEKCFGIKKSQLYIVGDQDFCLGFKKNGIDTLSIDSEKDFLAIVKQILLLS